MTIEVGTAYYPEDWDRGRIMQDAEWMQQAGVRYARMAEFAWSHMEPAEGVFDFQWLHDAVDILGQHGIKTILCTPSSAAPAWMCRKYPEILRMQRDGTKAWFGVRDHTCYTSVKYREFCLRMARKMAESFKDDPNVYGWQIDNEPGCSRFPDCFCPDCQKAFQNRLRKKYGTLDNLNKAWGTTFWSGEFRAWEEIELENRMENMGSCRVLESKLFRSDEQRDFILLQAAEIRKIMPHTLIGTNNYCLTDMYDVFKGLDFAGADLYPFNIKHWYGIAHAIDTYRCVKPGCKPWILETLIGGGWPRYDLDPLHFWKFVGHGCDKIFYFHWNHHEAGNEKDHPTILSMTGKPGWRYEKFKTLIAEAQSFTENLPLPESLCALVFDYDNNWRYALGFPDRYALAGGYSVQCHALMRRSGDAVDIISSRFDFSKYKLLVLQNHCYIPDALAEKLKTFVANGGVLLMNGRVGMYDEYARNRIGENPDKIADLLGFTIGEDRVSGSIDGDYNDSYKIPVYRPDADFAKYNTIVRGELNGKQVAGTFSTWTCFLQIMEGTEVLMQFGESCLEGQPFMTCRKYGKGHVLYYAADAVNLELLHEIILHARHLAGLNAPELPENVDMIRRGDYLFCCNFNDHAVQFAFPCKRGENKIGTALQNGTINLDKFSAAVIHITE